MRWLKRIGIGAVIVAIACYLAIVGVMYVLQRDLQYDRSGRLLGLDETLLSTAELVSIDSGDGSKLAGWYAPPAAGRPLILYFRGNSQSFSAEHERFEAWTADGYGFLAFDYRGFPGSPGDISEENILADALAAFDWVAAKQVPIVLWGRSLGSGPATYVASLREAGALLLETPFRSAVAVAEDRYGLLPVNWLMFDRFPVEDWIGDVEERVFVAHGTADTTVGHQHGERVHALAPNPDALWIEPGAGHSDMWSRGLWTRAKAFFERTAR